MGRRSESSRSRRDSTSLTDFKEFHVPKIVQVLFLLGGITLGVVITALIKNSMSKPSSSMEDLDLTEENIPDEAPRQKPRLEKQRAQASRPVQARRLAPRVPAAPKPPMRRIPPVIAQKTPERPAPAPAPRIVPKVRETSNFESLAAETPQAPAPAPQAPVAAPVPEPKAPLKKVVVNGLIYDRDSFQNCSEDCQLTLHSTAGQTIRVRLKKSQFMNSLDRQNSRIDIEGYATEDRTVLVEAVRAHPKREASVPELQLPPVKEPEEVRKLEVKKPEVKKPVLREEFADVDDDVPTPEPAPKAKTTRSQAQSLKSRLEASTGGNGKPVPTDDDGGSFQDRLRRSTR